MNLVMGDSGEVCGCIVSVLGEGGVNAVEVEGKVRKRKERLCDTV
jgi:hypothetical protein